MRYSEHSERRLAVFKCNIRIITKKTNTLTEKSNKPFTIKSVLSTPRNES
uniref:Uncharacterized protein n=1 Tax=Escherichia coli TaxID=562 RepID=A0A089VFP6_ECOLX|nr:hypothetical protein [Escherichia coli]UVD62314.1 hypothetical protein TC4I_011 [Escherichia coli]CEG62577.2 hypothetical protein [Salmonella enterica]